MKNSNIIKLIAFFSAVILIQAFNATGVQAAACTASSNSSCEVTPSSVKFKFFEVGLCKSKPTKPSAGSKFDMSDCNILFKNTNGVEVNISDLDVSIPLADNLTITEDTYTRAYMIIDNAFEMKVEHQFNTARIAKNSTGNTTGTYCYTNGSPLFKVDGLTCGDDPSDATHSSMPHLWQPGPAPFNHRQPTLLVSVGGSTAVETEYYLLDVDYKLATNDYISIVSGIPIFDNTTTRKFILADQLLASPIKISSETTALKILFEVTESVELVFTDASDPSCGRCLLMTDTNGVKLNISSN